MPANELDFESLKRATRLPISEQPLIEVFVLSAEDTVLQKLRWFKLGNGMSDQQWRDIMGVIKIKDPELDRDYLNKWAKKLNLEELLTKVMDDAIGP